MVYMIKIVFYKMINILFCKLYNYMVYMIKIVFVENTIIILFIWVI